MVPVLPAGSVPVVPDAFVDVAELAVFLRETTYQITTNAPAHAHSGRGPTLRVSSSPGESPPGASSAMGHPLRIAPTVRALAACGETYTMSGACGAVFCWTWSV